MKLSLIGKDGEIIAVDRFTTKVNCGVYRPTAQSDRTPFGLAHYYIVVSPYFLGESDVAKSLWYTPTLTEEREVMLTLDEARAIKKVKCEFSFGD